MQVEVGPAATSLRGAADYGVEISNHHLVSKLFVGSSIVRHCTCQKKWRECCGGKYLNIKPNLSPCGFCVKLRMYCRLHLKPEYG